VSGENPVPDEKLTASTSYDGYLGYHGPSEARLNNTRVDSFDYFTAGAWVADPLDTNQFIQVCR